MSPTPRPKQDGKILDEAVKKLEAKEAKAGTTPTPSIGRAIRDGWKEGA